MSPRVLSYVSSLFSLLREIQYTLARASQEPLAAVYIPTFQAHRESWQTILLQEISYLDDLARAQAAINKADQKIDFFSGRVSRAVDDNTDGNTRKQLRSALFKNKPLSRFRRPVLGAELAAMRDWKDILSNCGVPALAALAPEVEPLLAAADQATAMRDKAQGNNREFRQVGDRKQFIDKLNASRKEAHGQLAKLPFEMPNLPTDFADGFFSPDPAREEEETIDEVKTAVEELQAKLDERMALLKKLEEEAENAAREEAERKSQAEAADDLEAQAKALLERAAVLKAKAKK